jgi:molybdate transport repressor ModE-like protein
VDWDDLRYLLAVHRTGSLAKAARELNVTKATASRRLAALEEAAGTKLMTRTPKGLALTEAGKEAVAAAESIAATVERLSEKVRQSADGAPRGTVHVTAPPWLAERMLIPALTELRERYAELDVQLNGTNQLLNIAQREADLAIRNVRPEQASVTSKKLIELGGCVYASKLYLERRSMPAGRQQLGGHDLLVYATIGGMPGFEWLREEETGGRIAFRANDPAALVSAASAGLGLCAVPCLLGDAEPALQRVKTLGFNRCDLFLVAPEGSRSLQRVKVVGDFLTEVLQRHRKQIEG